MKSYELIIEKHQPPCSGKPILHEFSEVQTDDPIAYVKAHTKNAKLEVDTNPDNSLAISAEEGEYITKFVFSEI